jgi:glucose/arabinose dehydrogenase
MQQDWRRFLRLCVLISLLGSCQRPVLERASDAPADAAPMVIPSDAEMETTAPNPIPTRTLIPEPIVVAIDDLPEPYASDSARKSPQVIAPPADASLNVPAGFRVNIFAEGLDRPRWLALTPDGDVLVTETRQNRIRRLVDDDRDGAADQIETFATANNGLDIPFGMAFAEGYFFLGNTDEVRRYAFAPGQTALNGQGDRRVELPGGGYNQHWTRNVVVSPAGDRLYVSVGSRSNADIEPLPRASVQTMAIDGQTLETFASGLRNPVGLDFHPVTGDLYTTVNERDGLGDDLVPDYFARLQQGDFFGWPYSYLSPQYLDPRHQTNGVSQAPDQVRRTKTPDILFQSHSAALGLQFYDGETFPDRYRNGAFVAFRGSWNRSTGTGYKVVFIPFDANGKPTGHYEDFLTGFLVDPQGPTTWARPVGLLVMPDGSLLLTDEANNRVYRIQYHS